MVDPTQSLSGGLNRADVGHVGALGNQASTHPTPLGRRAFIAGLAGATAAATVASSAHAAAPPTGASYYKALAVPLRVADTRPEYGNKTYTTPGLPNTIRIKLTDFPGASGAVAAVISIAVLGNGKGGYVRATPAGDTSFVANVLLDAQDVVVTNLATVKLSGGAVDITGSQPYHVVVDISGVYLPTTTNKREGRLKYLSSVYRIADNVPVPHNGKHKISVAAHVPSSATAVVVNLTAAYATGNGYLTAYAIGLSSPPVVANVNYSVGETRGAGAIVKIGEAGGVRGFEVYMWGGGRVYADISGYITGPGDEESDAGLFVAIKPVRLLDTRRQADIALALGKRRLWAGWTRPFTIPANSTGFPAAGALSGVAMNVTSVTSMNGGYITVLPAQTPRRIVSNLNISRPGQTVANHVISQVSTKGVECYSWAGADVVCDIAGWYVGTAQPWTQPVPVDPPPPGAALPWTLSVPDITKRYGPALINQIRPDLFSADRVVDVGDSWHWTNTGLVGQSASVVIFGHRTSGSGPYYNQHKLNGANLLYVYTPDLRLFTYRRVREVLTNSSATNILNATRVVAGETISMVACTGRGTPQSPGVLNDQPLGGIAWRIITTFALESWADISPPID